MFVAATIPAAVLRQALDSVRWAAEKRQTILALNCALIEVRGRSLTLSCTDLDHYATYAIELESGAGLWSGAVPVAQLRKAIPAAGMVSLSFAGNVLQMVTDGRSVSLPCLVGDDASAFETFDLTKAYDAASIEMPAADFAKVCGRTLFAVSTEETRYYLNGTLIHRPDLDRDPSAFRAVTTDGHRLASLDFAPVPRGAWEDSILRRELVSALGKLAGAKGAAGPVRIEQAKGGIALRVTFGGLTVWSKAIDGTFPDYSRVIPAYRSGDPEITTIHLQASDLLASVADMGSKTEKWEAVLCAGAGQPLRVWGGMTGGDATQDSDVVSRIEGAAVTIGFNAQYLRDAAKAFDKDSVQVLMGGAGSPIVMTNGRGYRVVVMPMRHGKEPPARVVVAPVVTRNASLGAQIIHHAAPTCPLDIEGYDGDAHPDAEQVRHDRDELDKVPEGVRGRVRVALDSLRMIAEGMAHLRRTVGARYVREAWDHSWNREAAGPLALLERFRAAAPANNVDAEAALRALGGVPDLSLTAEEVDYFRPHVPEPADEPEAAFPDLQRIQAFAARHGMHADAVAGPLSVLSGRYLARRDRLVQAVETFAAASVAQLCAAQNPATYVECGTLVPADDGSGPVRYVPPPPPADDSLAAFLSSYFGPRWAIGRKRKGSDRTWITQRQYDAACRVWEEIRAGRAAAATASRDYGGETPATFAAPRITGGNVVALADWVRRRSIGPAGSATRPHSAPYAAPA